MWCLDAQADYSSLIIIACRNVHLGISPAGLEQASSPICMSSDNQPVSVYDLAGLQVTLDNGKTVYLVVQTVPLTKVQITAAQNYNTNIWLPVSKPILDTLATATTVPRVTTEV